MKPLCTLMFFLKIAIKPDIKNINVKLFKTPFILGKMSSFDPKLLLQAVPDTVFSIN